MERYFQPEIECASREQIKAWQDERLVKQVRHVWDNVPSYRKKMEEKGVTPEDIQSSADLYKLPFTSKADLRDNYPDGLVAVPRSKCVRVHATSGTTGKRVMAFYTQHDIDLWTDCCARAITAVGGSEEDVCQIAYGYGMFTGALGLHNGLEKVGAAIVPSSTGNTQKQLMYMKDFESTLLVATPSYAMRIAEVAKEMGMDPKKDLKIHTLLLGSELMTEAMRTELYKVWGYDVNLTQNYGMSELMGPGVSGECLELNGMHINEDHFLAEVIDPKTGQVLAPGEKGELVITCLTKEALPLIRYRTRDITRLMYEPCPCGRTTVRMENLSGRTDDMLKIRGVNVFPSQIEEVLINTEGIGPNYEIVLDRKNHSDILTIKVEVEAEAMMDSYAALERLDYSLREKMRMMLGLDAKIQLVSPNTLQRFEGKAKRVTDLRNDPQKL